MAFGRRTDEQALSNISSATRSDRIAETACRLLKNHDRIAAIMEKIAIKPEELVRPDDPYDIYTIEGIANDRNKVEELDAIFASRNQDQLPNGLTLNEVRKLAERLEYEVIRGINIGKWYPGVRADKTSKIDDYLRGIDAIFRFSEIGREGYIGLGVDVSFSQNLLSKFKRIKDEIDHFDGEDNRLGVVKYYRNKQGFRGELSNLPRIVVAFDLGVIEDMTRAKGDSLREHMSRHLLLIEAETQLAVFTEYARRNNPACMPYLEKSYRLIRALSEYLNSKKQLLQSEYRKNRKVDAAIEAGLSLFQ